MNILFVTSNFPPRDGGIATFNYHICKALSARGHKVIVIAKRFQGSEDFDSRREFYIKRFNGKVRPTALQTIHKISSFALKKKIQIIFFGHFASTHWLGGVLVRKILKIPYVILVHGTEFSAYFHRFTRVDHWASGIVLRSASTIIVNSRATKKLVEDNGYPSGKIHIIHPGTDTDNFKSYKPAPNLIDKFGLKDKKILMTASRLVAKKNHRNVLQALLPVIQKIPDLVYLILGKGEEEGKLKELTKDIGLEKYVKFVGYIEPNKMPLYYNICDIFVMPSKTVDIDYESFGIVYTEANACGKPVIASRTGGIEDAVIDGFNGILVDPFNIREISESIVFLLTNQEYARKLGENGRQRAEKELNWGMMGEKIEKILEKTIERH